MKADLSTITEAATYLGCSTRTIRRYIADGRIKAFRVGARMIRVDRAELDGLLRPLAHIA